VIFAVTEILGLPRRNFLKGCAAATVASAIPGFGIIRFEAGAAVQTLSGARHLTSLTHQEQYSYMSTWLLMAALLIFSGDMRSKLQNESVCSSRPSHSGDEPSENHLATAAQALRNATFRNPF
jgi:hypothetical protein